MAKNTITYEQIIADLRKKVYSPVYMLMGAEAYYIDKITDFIQDNILDESQREFDLTVVYGKDTDISTIVNVAKRYPMLSPYQVVIVKEAQYIKDWDALQYYLQKPLKSTILVFGYKYGTIDRRKKWVQDISKIGVLFESQKYRDYQITKWITEYTKSKKIGIDLKAVEMLTEFLGTDLSKIANELDKLLLTMPVGTNRITPEHVEKNIGISKDFNVFELQTALVANNSVKSYRIIRYFADNKKSHPMLMILAQLFSFFSNIMMYHYLSDKSQSNVASELKVHPYFVKEYESAAKRFGAWKTMNIISWIRETDARGKGIDSNGVDEGDLMKELIYKILN